MKREMYCFNCDKNVKYATKKVKNAYTIHNIDFEIEEDINYCPVCKSELINDTLDNDLMHINEEYLKIYGLSFAKFKEIRNSLNLSQESFAKALGWSKKTITRYENSQSLPQSEYLSVYKRIMNNKMEFIKILQERKEFLLDKEYYSILNKVNADLDIKTINVFLYLLRDNYLSSTQIMKNFFAIDFDNYKKNQKPITKFKYAHAPFGPIIDNKDAYLNLLVRQGYLQFFYDDSETILFKPCMQCDLKLFNESELEIIREVKNALKGKSANELTHWSHGFKGWKETKNGKIIDYKYAKYFDLTI